MESLTANQKQAEETMRSKIMLEQKEMLDSLRDQLNDAMQVCCLLLLFTKGGGLAKRQIHILMIMI